MMMNISNIIQKKHCRVGDKRLVLYTLVIFPSDKNSRVQVFSLSDIHADNAACKKWFKENCVRNHDDDVFSVFICAGDISHDVDVIRDTFAHLKAQYDEVCYVPGNHDLWRRGSALPAGGAGKQSAPCSVTKLNEILQCALAQGVTVGPLRIHTNSHGNLYIYPLYAWYHSGWDTEPILSHPLYTSCERLKQQHGATMDASWMDFRCCSWQEIDKQQSHGPPSVFRDDTAVPRAFAELNEKWLPSVRAPPPDRATGGCHCLFNRHCLCHICPPSL